MLTETKSPFLAHLERVLNQKPRPVRDEEAIDLLIDLGLAAERHGVRKGKVQLLNAPDQSFTVTKTKSEIMVIVHKGEWAGKVVFLYTYEPEQKLVMFRRGAWQDVVKRLCD